ncbi:hypothetical protein P692DRAFT_20781404, partial [Suillus brevipes Sb2]
FQFRARLCRYYCPLDVTVSLKARGPSPTSAFHHLPATYKALTTLLTSRLPNLTLVFVITHLLGHHPQPII